MVRRKHFFSTQWDDQKTPAAIDKIAESSAGDCGDKLGWDVAKKSPKFLGHPRPSG